MLDAIVPFLKELILIPLTLLPIINPLSSAPVLIANAGRDPLLVKRLARQVSLNSFYVIIAAMLVGTNVLAIVGISLPILRVGGGLLVCATAWRMLGRAESDDVQEKAAQAAGEMPEAEVVRRSFFPLTFPLSTAMTESGAAAQLADGVVAAVGGAGPYALLAGFFLLTAILGQLISNMATAIIVIPIAVAAALELGMSARPPVPPHRHRRRRSHGTRRRSSRRRGSTSVSRGRISTRARYQATPRT